MFSSILMAVGLLLMVFSAGMLHQGNPDSSDAAQISPKYVTVDPASEYS